MKPTMPTMMKIAPKTLARVSAVYCGLAKRRSMEGSFRTLDGRRTTAPSAPVTHVQQME
jgi:hypothetical protein